MLNRHYGIKAIQDLIGTAIGKAELHGRRQMKFIYNPEIHSLLGYENDQWIPLFGHVYPGKSMLLTEKTFLIDRYRLEVSLACNLKCEYCVVYMNRVAQENRLMSLETAQKIVARFNHEVGASGSIFIMGGEPLVNYSVVRYIVENSLSPSIIFTNALELDEDKIDFFRKNSTFILTSLDGYTIEQNQKRFGRNNVSTFDKVKHNISLAIKKGCKVGVSCLLHKDNVTDALAIAHFFVSELGAKSMSFAYPHLNLNDSEENHFDFELYLKQMIALFEFSKQNRVYIDQIGKIINSIMHVTPSILGCKAGTSQRTFYPDGSETICTKIDTYGNYDVNEYIKGLPYYSFNCQSCIARSLCIGECPWDYLVAMQTNKGHRRLCNYRKMLIEYIINDMIKELEKASSIEEAKQIFDDIFSPMTDNYSSVQ